ncbi:serine/threonine-protein kinase [Arcanobacterium canis]|uniref:non-specific serine/threonine protein kinase n=1 Tax=Arcanobacterium canis TaxID=999183 RepID=A0ABY8FXZ9_9ACTO|nr:serine/threonine-protein kinase [Arcanobacterium canis]WFM83343.1 serine/threonine-protein kinase [Arcanobacterium canis]
MRTPASAPVIEGATYIDYIASGGFADVYLYEQSIPKRQVAVKVTQRGLEPERQEAFRREADIQARVSGHPHIANVFGAGETCDGRLYLMMEYCPLPSLAKRVAEKPLSIAKVLELGIQLASAVDAMHRAGVVHRDIKPANILYTAYGAPVLTDFGIAYATDEPVTPAVGFSAPWAPPEQALGEGAVGPSADIYSLAATIYTALVGHAPFTLPGGDNREVATITRVLNAPVPSLGDAFPAELDRALATAMAKDPGLRFESALDFAYALAAIQEKIGEHVTPIDVPSYARNATSGADVDEDVTRAAVRRIDFGPDTTSLPLAAGQVGAAKRPSARPLTEKDRRRRRRTGMALAFCVGVVSVVGGLALATRGGGTVEPHQSDAYTTGVDPIDHYVAPVTGLTAHTHGTKVRFTWKYAQGFSFIVKPQNGGKLLTVTEPSVELDAGESATCVEISALAASGKESEPVSLCVAR